MDYKTLSQDFPHGEPDFWGFYSIDNAPDTYEFHDRIEGAVISGWQSCNIERLPSFLRRAMLTADVLNKVTGREGAIGACYGVRCRFLRKIRWYAMPAIPPLHATGAS